MPFKFHSPSIINSSRGIRKDFVNGLRTGGNGDMSNQIGGQRMVALKETTRNLGRDILGSDKSLAQGF